MIKLAPSILAASRLRLGEEIARMADAGCDFLHVDIMDAHFVPNLSFDPQTVKEIKAAFPDLKQDVHLMMDNPSKYIDAFASAGAWGITIHAEIPEDVPALLKKIRALGLSAGLSVKPGTPAEAIRELLPLCDLVLVMTVEPGFGGQSFNEAMLKKMQAIRDMGFTGLIEADGGLSMKNLQVCMDHSLDVAVMGTALFKSADPKADIEKMHAM